MTEREFQHSVMELAELSGWETLHVRTSMQADGRYLTATSGTMAKGWPDLVLVKDDRLLFVELKGPKGRIRPDQSRVLQLLEKAAEVHVWRPADWPFIEETLMRRRAA